MDFDVELWTALRDQARREMLKQLPAPIVGYDQRNDAISFSNGNARAAGVGHLVKFERRDLRVRNVRPRDRVAILSALGEPLDEGVGRSLARGR